MELRIIKNGGMILEWQQIFLSFYNFCSGSKSEKTTALCSNDVTSRIQNRNQVRTRAQTQLSNILTQLEQRLSIHLGLFTEESYTVPSINIYVLWSREGLGWKGEAMSALNICPNVCLKSTDKNKTLRLMSLLQICSSCSLWVAAFKFIQNSGRKKIPKNKTQHCTVRFSQSLCKKEK